MPCGAVSSGAPMRFLCEGKKRKMLKEFKEFAMRGNVIDLAVGVVIGAAFGKIVASLVADVIMPPIGLLLGGLDFSNFFMTLKGESFATLAEAQEAGAVTLNYGLFILVIKQINRLKRQEEAKPAAPAAPPRNEVLLEEIRDLLAKN